MINTLASYAIAHKGLKIGHHHFDFKVDDSFFAAFEPSDMHGGEADVSVEMDKQGSAILLHFLITGKVQVTCDRCLEEFMTPIYYEGDLTVRFSETENESDGEILWLSPSENEIPLAQYIYESIYLSLPYQRVHPSDASGHSDCNPDMLARFQIVTEEEFDHLAAQAEEQTPQPAQTPWSPLEKLKQQMEE
ncbi:MAG: DUF177 domain-containing protein [Alistipes sp.]|nr:DUF177 domain-containing protein [Alistipes sp.]